jgi:hypothetical protein
MFWGGIICPQSRFLAHPLLSRLTSFLVAGILKGYLLTVSLTKICPFPPPKFYVIQSISHPLDFAGTCSLSKLWISLIILQNFHSASGVRILHCVLGWFKAESRNTTPLFPPEQTYRQSGNAICSLAVATDAKGYYQNYRVSSRYSVAGTEETWCKTNL